MTPRASAARSVIESTRSTIQGRVTECVRVPPVAHRATAWIAARELRVARLDRLKLLRALEVLHAPAQVPVTLLATAVQGGLAHAARVLRGSVHAVRWFRRRRRRHTARLLRRLVHRVAPRADAARAVGEAPVPAHRRVAERARVF